MKTSLWLLLMVSACAQALVFMVAINPAGASEQVVRPKQLCIYYGWPSCVNGADGNVTRAVTAFSACDLIVFGDGIEHPTHGDHWSARSIIGALRQAGKEVFGYVDLGVSTQNLPVETMQAYVNEWQGMGASGIFFDDAGYDYGVTRARQNEMVDHVHNAGMTVFVNAWDVDDVLSDFDEAGQWSPSRVTTGDVYLAESWLVSGGVYLSLRDWAVKADKARQYVLDKGIRVAGVTTAKLNRALAGDMGTNRFRMGFYGAAMYNLAAWQWTDIGYSAGNDKLMLYDTSAWDYGMTFIDDSITHLKNYNRHERRTDTGKIVVSGNGASSGTGSFVPY